MDDIAAAVEEHEARVARLEREIQILRSALRDAAAEIRFQIRSRGIAHSVVDRLERIVDGDLSREVES